VDASRTHFVIAVRRHEQTYFLLWFDGDQDGVVAEAGRLVVFASDAAARAHAVAGDLVVSSDESAYFDLDELEAWVAAPNPHRIKPDELLNVWNLLGDVARSVDNDLALARLVDRKDNETYRQLMSCCNIPALDFPVSDRPRADDCLAIAAALRHGVACFDAALPPVSPPAPAPR
jgi:hypothetical protein